MRRREQRRFSPGPNLNTSLGAFSHVDERHADHRNPPTWFLMTGDRNACDQRQRNRNTRQDAPSPTQANPARDFWAVSQGEPARNAATRRRFPRSAEPTANKPRRKPHRSPGPWRNRRPFPAKQPRIRRGATAGEASAAVSADAGAHPTSQGPACRQGHSNRQRRQRMGLPPLLGRVPAQRVAISAGSCVCAYQ